MLQRQDNNQNGQYKSYDQQNVAHPVPGGALAVFGAHEVSAGISRPVCYQCYIALNCVQLLPLVVDQRCEVLGQQKYP